MILNIHGKQYNLAGFEHPGGNEILELSRDEPDCTALFESYHAFSDMDKIKTIMKKYEVKDVTTVQMFKFEPDGFYNTLRGRVIQHFEHKNGHKLKRGDVKANFDWLNTTIWLWSVFLFSQYQMLFGEHWFVRSIFGLVSGISLTGLGFNVMHDASHYAVSSNYKVNQLLSSFHLGLQMWNQLLWGYHHVIRHHQYTGNIDYDPDMRHTMPFIRKTNKIKSKPNTFTRSNFVFKFLFLNVIFPGNLFGQGLLYHLIWVRKGYLWHMNLPSVFDMSTQAGQYLLSTLFFVNMFWFGGWYTAFHIIGTNLTYFVGLSPDHDLFPTHLEINKFGDMSKMDWGETQVRGSANFCNSYMMYTKSMGGINYQIEHHLFPSMCNHYLSEIAPIVHQTCKEFNIPYNHIAKPIDVFNKLMATYYDVYENDDIKID
jgi:fatty acid desaturase